MTIKFKLSEGGITDGCPLRESDPEGEEETDALDADIAGGEVCSATLRASQQWSSG